MFEKLGCTPPAPDDWLSSNKLISLGYVGHRHTIDRKILELRTRLVADAVSRGLSGVEANDFVEEHLIGERKPNRGPSSIYLNPVLLTELGLKHREHATIPGETSWTTANALSKTHIGKPATIVNRIQSLRRRIVDEIIDSSGDESLALWTVQKYLIAEKKLRHDYDPIIHVSPDAVRILESEGLARRSWVDSISSTDSKRSK